MKRKISILLLFSCIISFLIGIVPTKTYAKTSDDYYNLTPDNTALIIIDVQNNFIPGNPYCYFGDIPGQDMNNKLSNVKKLIDSAKLLELKTLVTYERFDSNFASMPKDLFDSLPFQNTRQYIKTYFDITKKGSIYEELKYSNIKNVIVCGAETDVCVSQSVRGLLNNGYNVFLAEDATYTSTTLNTPALRFMQKSGANIYTTDEIINSLKDNTPIQATYDKNLFSSIPDLIINDSAMVVVNFDDVSLANNSDPKKEAKLERIRFMCNFSRITQLPIYFIYDDNIDELKNLIDLPDTAKLIKVDNIDAGIQDILIDNLSKDNRTNIMFAGIDENSLLFNSCNTFKENNFEVHLLEDAFFKANSINYNDFEDFYNKNIVPSSLKISFYDIGDSASADEGPINFQRNYIDEVNKGVMPYIESLPFVIDSQESFN